MLFKSLVKATLLATAIAAPLQHQHHQHEDKRDVKVVTQTSVVVVTLGSGQTSTVAAAAAPTAEAKAVASSSSSGDDEDDSSASSSSPSSSEDSSSSSTEGSSSSSDSSSSGSVSGGKGITYSPYSDDGGCKSSSQIASEIKQLDSYDIIRLYAVDCDQVNAVMSAKKSNQKIFAGIYDVNSIEDTVDTLSKAVNANGGWDHIHTVSVGNELVNSGEATVSQVKGYVSSARSALKSAGYSGNVVAVDTFIATINNPGLCDISDYHAVNAHAFFDGGVAADGAGKWVLEQIERVSSTCGGNKKVLVTETGWPSKGDTNNKAVPSVQNQKSAISSISETCGNDAILFTAFNDLWKSDGAYNAEKYWGILSN